VVLIGGAVRCRGKTEVSSQWIRTLIENDEPHRRRRDIRCAVVYFVRRAADLAHCRRARGPSERRDSS